LAIGADRNPQNSNIGGNPPVTVVVFGMPNGYLETMTLTNRPC
jgi:hypothetical protein